MEKYIRILIKNHYDKPTDLVSRKLNRAICKIDDNFQNMITNDGVYLYGYIVDNQIFELFTGNELDIDSNLYEIVLSDLVVKMLESLKNGLNYYKVYALISNILFDGKFKIDFVDISSMEELSNDRYQLFDEYNNNLTTINPYSDEYSRTYDDVKIMKKRNVRR